MTGKRNLMVDEVKDLPEEEIPEFQWYAIHTYSGFENRVKASLIERMKAMGHGHELADVLIPSEEVVELHKGKRRVSERKVFPGYILVKMKLNDETWHVVK
jgi:transcriptional antiterminator NusG